MNGLLLLLVFNVLVIVGVWASTGKGMIFERMGEDIETLVGKFWSKPLIDCPPCMASFWGSIVFWWQHPFTWDNALTWPFYVLALCGLGKLVAHKLLTE